MFTVSPEPKAGFLVWPAALKGVSTLPKQSLGLLPGAVVWPAALKGV